jgi:adenosylcobyric acid synthase
MQGWDIDVAAHVRRGGCVLGVCGGYQMLGRTISDPQGVEGPPGAARGLSLLDVETVLTATKTLQPVTGAGFGARLTGYEMHVGVTTGLGLQRPFLDLDGEGAHGACTVDDRVMGGYVHGLFETGGYRAAFLDRLGAGSTGLDHGARVDEALDEIADQLDRHLDIAMLARIAGLETLPE